MASAQRATQQEAAGHVVIRRAPGARWTAVYTRPRCEKVVEALCDRLGLLCYLPVRRRAKRYQRRLVETFVPMFPGYVFVQLREPDSDRILRSQKVVAVLPMDPSRETRLVQDLQDVQRLVRAEFDGELVVRPDLVAGEPVQIVAGPLEGLRGIIQRRQDKSRVSVNVELLGQSVSTELDAGEVVVLVD